MMQSHDGVGGVDSQRQREEPTALDILSSETRLHQVLAIHGIIPQDEARYHKAVATLEYILSHELLKGVTSKDINLWAQLGNSLLRRIGKYAETKENIALYDIYATSFNNRISELGLAAVEGDSP